MNKFFASLLAAFLAVTLALAGCSSGGISNTAGSQDEQSQEGVEGNQEKYTVSVGYVMAEGTPADQAVVRLAEILEERTNGQIIIERFPNSQLGGERDMLEGMKVGTVDVVVTGDLVFTLFAPEYAAFSMPYAMRSIDHMLNVLNGPIGQEVSEAFNQSLDSTVIDWWVRGPRNLTANKEIKTPDDLNGLKIRVPELKLSVEVWKALGASPTPMAFPELFVALQQGVVDGQENPLDLIYASKFYEVQSHVMLTEHTIAPYVFLINDKKLQSFPEDLRQIFVDAVREAGQYEIQLTLELEEDFKNKLREAGMTVVEVDKELWAKKLEEANVAKQFEKDWSPNLLQRIKDTK